MTVDVRLLDLLALFQQRRYWSGQELAARLHVSSRTLRRDIDQLRELGYPVEATRGTYGGYQLASGGSLPPLVMDEQEAVAVVLGLHAMMTTTVEAAESASIRMLAKIVQVMPSRLRRRVDALTAIHVAAPSLSSTPPAVGIETLSTLSQACRDADIVTFTYSGSAAKPSIRRVEPHHVVLLGRTWYLICYDLDKRDWRTMRLDRIADTEPTTQPFLRRTLPENQTPPQFVQTWLGHDHGAHQVEVVIEAPISRVQEIVGRWGTASGSGSVTRLTMRIDDYAWIAHVLGAIGRPFAVIAPRDLEQYLTDWTHLFTTSLNTKHEDTRHSATARSATKGSAGPEH